MPPNPFLAAFDQTQALIAPTGQARFESCLYQVMLTSARLESATDKPKMAADDGFWFADDDWRSMLRPYIVKNGMLQIPVKGVLLHDFPYQLLSYATGYEYIWRAFERGMGDAEVKGIALICDTPGGAVAGNFDLVDKMYARRGEKPIRAFAMESAYSAGYSIASVADKVVVSRTGGVGSIGVVTVHVDYSKSLEENGIKVTFIHFGKHKVDGNPYEPLPDDVKARIQARIDELGEVFVQTVARNRGMDADVVRATEALTYTASQAVSNGLADEIGSLDDAVAAFAADLSLETKDEEMAMTEEEKKAAEQAAASAREEGTAAGRTEGAKAERTRINAIINSDEGKKRPTMALKMATNEKFAALDADTIVEMLADLPEEKATAAPPAATGAKGKDGAAADFANAMRKDNPELGEQASTDEEKEIPRHERALRAMGKEPKKAA